MIKYHRVLEDRNNYYLPLVDEYKEQDKRVRDIRLPETFYAKYRHLFFLAKQIIIKMRLINQREVFYRFYFEDYKKACDIDRYYDDLMYEMYEVDRLNSIDITSNEVKCLLSFCMNALVLLDDIYEGRDKIYLKWNELFEQAMLDLRKYDTIEYTNYDNADNIYLPDAWYITPYGNLYNTTGKNGHKDANLYYRFYDARDAIVSPRYYEAEMNLFLETRNRILHDKAINRFDFKFYLNYASTFFSLNIEKKEKWFELCYSKNVVETILGIVEAQIALSNFLSKISRFTDDPSSELKKVRKMTCDDINDVLVRCCNMHKVESMLDKTITTSALDYKIRFSEYIKRGWTINFLSPIIVSKENKSVEKIDMTSLVVQRFIENQEYMTCDELSCY